MENHMCTFVLAENFGSIHSIVPRNGQMWNRKLECKLPYQFVLNVMLCCIMRPQFPFAIPSSKA